AHLTPMRSPRHFFFPLPRPPSSTLSPYTTLFRSRGRVDHHREVDPTERAAVQQLDLAAAPFLRRCAVHLDGQAQIVGHLGQPERSEEHTSELQSRENLVCRLLLEKKKKVDSDTDT